MRCALLGGVAVALALALACDANDVVLYGAAAGAADVNGEGAVGDVGKGGSDASGGAGGSSGLGATGGTPASGGKSASGGAETTGGSSTAGGSTSAGGATSLGNCTADDDCGSPSWYCSRLNCDDPAGVCFPIPISCEANFDPVCGCDNITYLNMCVLQTYGVSARHPRDCNDMNIHPPCMSDEECGDGRTCAHLFTAPGAPGDMNCGYRTGTCWGVPFDCDGSDGDMLKWVPCGPPPMGSPECVSTCVAIQSRGAYVRAQPDMCP